MKQGWTIQPLGHIVQFINGDRGKNYPSRNDFVCNGIPFINTGHLCDGQVSLKEMNYITQEKYEALSQGKVCENDILFCLRGSLGKHAIVSNISKGAIASSLVIIRCKDAITPSFLSYYLDGDIVLSAIRKENSGSNQPNLSVKTMKDFLVPVPSISEQQRIVKLLDDEFVKIDALKSNAEKNLQNAKDLFQAALKKELEPKEEWQIKEFETCLEKTKVTAKIPSASYQEKGAYPIVSQEQNLISGYWNNEGDVFKHTSPIIVFGDHTKVVKYIDFDFVIGADGVKVLQPKSLLNPKFFFYWVRSLNIPSHGYARHYRYLKENNIPVPSLLEQQCIVTRLDALNEKCDTLQANYEKTLTLCDDLKQALLRKAFNGEI